MKRFALLLTLGLLAGSAHASDFSFEGYADFRLIVPSKQGSYYYGDLGKLRYGYDNGATAAKFVGAIGEARWHPTPELMLVATGRLDPNYGPTFDLLEAYARYRPVSTGPWRWTVKAGAFFPPISLENGELGWTSPWTITPSAINSWVGYELRTIGTEGTLEWRSAERVISVSAALYGWNDPAGALIADRGWSLDDRPSGLFERERLPDALAIQFGATPPLETNLFRQIGSTPGWYADAKWSESGVGDFTVMRYDNEANPSLAAGDAHNWLTDFWSAGFKKQIDDVTLLAQALTGSTEIRVPGIGESTTHFGSAYALAGLDLGDWRLATRFDVFRTHSLGTLPSLDSENGCAGTVAASWFPRSWLTLTAEAIVLTSAREERVITGDAVRNTEREFQLMARVYF